MLTLDSAAGAGASVVSSGLALCVASSVSSGELSVVSVAAGDVTGELGDSAGVSDEQAASDRPRGKHGKSGDAASVFRISGSTRPAHPRAPYLHHHRH